jgi:hypothetical protein
MNQFLMVLGLVAFYLVLNRFILPKLGVPT